MMQKREKIIGSAAQPGCACRVENRLCKAEHVVGGV